MAVNTQVIEIVTKFTDGASKKIREVSQKVEQLGGGMERVTNTTKTLNKATNRLRKSQEVSRVVAKRFQMQWLSILFFGMAMQRMFLGLIRTSLEWVGVTELWTQTLGIFFLPIAELLLEALLPIMDWFMNAPTAVKLFVGAIAVLGIGIGSLLSGLGQVALGLAGIKWLIGAKNISAFKTSVVSTTTKVNLLKFALKGIVIGAGIAIAWLGFTFIRKGIEEGSLLTEVMGILAIGFGAAAVGLTFGGPAGGVLGFTIGVSIGILVSWFIKSSKIAKSESDIIRKRLEEAGAPSLDVERIVKEFEDSTGPNFFGLKIPGFQSGGVVPGRLGSPVPILAHAGERVVPIGGGSSGVAGGSTVINVTYNVNVSDRREFESMLRENNIRLTEDVRRLIKN